MAAEVDTVMTMTSGGDRACFVGLIIVCAGLVVMYFTGAFDEQ